MISKNDVKYIQSLCHKKHRDEVKAFIAEGPKLAEEILKSGFQLIKGYAVDAWLQQQKQPLPLIQPVSQAELERISQLPSPNQVLLVVQQKQAQLPPLQQQIILMLDGIQDPGNLGTIIRTADWFGIQQIICSPDTADLYNNKVIQSTMGSFVRTNICYADLSAILSQNTMPVFGALLNGQNLFTKAPIHEGIILIGNEGKGIRPNIMHHISQAITIPQIGHAESLNAAVAAGIIMAHLTQHN